MTESPKAPKITIKKYVVNLDPAIEIYHVEVERSDGVWTWACPSREALSHFLEGLRAGCEAYVPQPEIPERAERFPPQEPHLLIPNIALPHIYDRRDED